MEQKMLDRDLLTLQGLLASSVEKWGDNNALITGDNSWTYKQFSAWVDDYAKSLIAMGVGKGTRVGLLMENRPEWLVFAFATTSIGALLVPVSTFAKPGDLEYQLRHADVSYLFMTSEFLGNKYLNMLLEVTGSLAGQSTSGLYIEALPALRRLIVKDEKQLPAGAESWQNFEAAGVSVPDMVLAGIKSELDSEDECYLLYTSGTTSKPKGVLQSHLAVARNGYMIGDCQGLQSDDVVWFYFPMFFSAGCINVMLGTFSHGASLILQPSFDVEEAVKLIDQEKATTWHIWPHQLNLLLQHPDWDNCDHKKLHKGTGALDVMLDIQADDGCGGVSMYGMTETCTAFTCSQANDSVDVRVNTHGALMPGNDLKIVDPESGLSVEDGSFGEICVKGPSVMQRYYKMDPTVVFDEAGFFHTGDLGWLDDNQRLHFEQRIKDMIKSGGINISPAEIEEKLCAMDGVNNAYAFPVPGGDKDELVGAALVVATRGDLPDEDILIFCKREFASYKRPSYFLILTEEDLPKTGSGKVQKTKLRDYLLEKTAGATKGIFRLESI